MPLGQFAWTLLVSACHRQVRHFFSVYGISENYFALLQISQSIIATISTLRIATFNPGDYSVDGYVTFGRLGAAILIEC